MVDPANRAIFIVDKVVKMCFKLARGNLAGRKVKISGYLTN